MNRARANRMDRILKRCIETFNLDLQGLTVFTEAATGPYLYSPILAALAGARKVYAVTADSKHGTKEQVKQQTLEAASRWNVAHQIEVIFEKAQSDVADSDIITNTGFVRPIDREMISWMKPTAVTPLMWETWEFREQELDLTACQEHGILVMGTDESKPPLSFYAHNVYLVIKLLFELGFEGYKTKTLFLGGNGGFASIYHGLKQLGMDICWFGDAEGASLPYSQLAEHFSAHGAEYDAMILADYANPLRLLGTDGLLTYELIKQINPMLGIGVVAGNVDVEGLKQSGLHFFPEAIQPFDYMSYQAYDLGPLPVLELYAAGLQVGQAMARARLQGMGIEEVKQYAMRHSAAMDF